MRFQADHSSDPTINVRVILIHVDRMTNSIKHSFQATSRLLSALTRHPSPVVAAVESQPTPQQLPGYSQDEVDSIVADKLRAERQIWQRKMDRLLNDQHAEDFSSAKIIAHTDGLLQTTPIVPSQAPSVEYAQAEQALIDCYRENLAEPLKCHQCVDRLRQLVRENYLHINQ
jgi:hypothetical protein